MKSNSSKRIGIIAPMVEEIEMILHHMEVEEKVFSGNRVYHLGKIEGREVVVALSGIGKVASSVTAAVMMESFKVTTLIVTGVAGGVHDSVSIGDVVVATQAVQHDMDCSPIFPKYEIPLTGITQFTLESSWLPKIVQEVDDYLKQEFTTTIEQQKAHELGITLPKVHQGLLLSGDQFIGTASQLERLQTDFPEALFVEMEGGAVAQICHDYQVPLIMFRSISDKANDSAHIDFNAYIHYISRHYTWQLVHRIVRLLPN
ncbi:MAG: 5'-methylthioadenosine/adenosylhomocysteine nucleosidase [Cytophagaceae bacterium]